MLGACLDGSPLCFLAHALQGNGKLDGLPRLSNDVGSPNAGKSKPTGVLDFSSE